MCTDFFFNATATTEIYTYLHTLSLHDALPICHWVKDSFVKRPSRIRDMTHGHDSYLEISRDLSADEPCADVCGFEAFSREQYGGLLQFVRRRLANEEDARAIAQESRPRLLRYRETGPATSCNPERKSGGGGKEV